jgi:hypothetical protein
MSPVRVLGSLAAAGVMALVSGSSALAATTVVVTPANQQGWSTADTRPGGTVTFVSDPGSPYPAGALQLTTDLTTTAKAQYLHAANDPLASVSELGYWTRQVSGPPFADPSYQLVMCLNGGNFPSCSGFTTLVFEPYQNTGEGLIAPSIWQQWNAASGLYWSTHTIVCSGGTVLGTPGGPATYTLDMIRTLCPEANVAGFGVNIGSNNPGYVVRTDGFDFNGTVYDFQLTNTPSSKDDCKDGGWRNLTDNDGNAFKNQGQCVAFANHQD